MISRRRADDQAPAPSRWPGLRHAGRREGSSLRGRHDLDPLARHGRLRLLLAGHQPVRRPRFPSFSRDNSSATRSRPRVVADCVRFPACGVHGRDRSDRRRSPRNTTTRTPRSSRSPQAAKPAAVKADPPRTLPAVQPQVRQALILELARPRRRQGGLGPRLRPLRGQGLPRLPRLVPRQPQA